MGFGTHPIPVKFHIHIFALGRLSCSQDRGVISPKKMSIYETHFLLTAHLITIDFLLTLFNGLLGP